MAARRARTTVTLAVLLVVLAAMAVWGFKAATAPLPGAGGGTKEACSKTETAVKTTLSRKEVQVSVYNAGKRAGLAASTLDKVETAGFRAGNSGNAPEDAKVRKAEVWTTKENDSAARLVALAFGRATRVVVTETDLGPGVDVLVGDRFRGLDRKAPKKIKLPTPVATCVEVG